MDLFAGCGGMSLGLENAGFEIVHANEINADAAETYSRNFPHVDLIVDDIRNIDVAKLEKELGDLEIDLIAAGPPCQGFSTAGRRNPDDPRNSLYLEVLRFVTTFRPKIVVIENVIGMRMMRRGAVLTEIKQGLIDLGYYPYTRELIASDFGVPQQRRRIFIIATKKEISEDELFPVPTPKKVSVAQAISDLSFLGVNESCSEYRWAAKSEYQMQMRLNNNYLFNHESPNHSQKIQRRFNRVPQGKNGNHVLKWARTSKRTYIKLNPRRESMTLTTLPEDFIHYKLNRILTVREIARLQSFPDHFEFLGSRTTGGPRRKFECPQYTQVGNAVPPLLAEAVFRKIRCLLE